MKKYIKPHTEIDIVALEAHILAGTDVHNEYSSADVLGNTGFFDDMEDSYPPKDKGLWDDQYKD